MKSNWLDFNDVAPLVGMPEQPAARDAPRWRRRSRSSARRKKPSDPTRKVLPTAPLDLARMKAMNSEVTYAAAKITNARHLPVDRISAGVNLKNGVLKLDPLSFGIAGGTMAGQLHIDSHSNPAVVEAHLKAKSLELSKMFRDTRLTQSSFGKIHGDIDLKGRGNTTAQMLATASGNVVVVDGTGADQQPAARDRGPRRRRNHQVPVPRRPELKLRCAAAAFDVKDGLMTSRALVLDTDDTVVWGDGTVNLGTEAMDLYFRPYPKDASILSVRSPLKITGTLGAPQTGPDKGALAGRAAAALAWARSTLCWACVSPGRKRAALHHALQLALGLAGTADPTRWAPAVAGRGRKFGVPRRQCSPLTHVIYMSWLTGARPCPKLPARHRWRH